MFVKNGRNAPRISILASSCRLSFLRPQSPLGVRFMALAFMIGWLSSGSLDAQESTVKSPAASPAGGSKSPPTVAVGESVDGSPQIFQNGIPSLVLFLKVGMERHPDVVIARSKVEAARSELLKAEAVALKSLMQLYQGVQAKRKVLEALKREHAAGRTPALRMQTEAAELNLLEWELALTLGFQGFGRLNAGTPKEISRSGDASASAIPDPPVYVELAYPKGVKADRIKKALDTELKAIDFVDVTLEDVRNQFIEMTQITFVIDKTGLAEQGFVFDAANLNVTDQEITLGAALQRFEDHNKVLYFVVRDYGILITTKESAPSDAVSVRDFWKLTEEEVISKYRAKRQSENESLGGMLGGF